MLLPHTQAGSSLNQKVVDRRVLGQGTVSCIAASAISVRIIICQKRFEGSEIPIITYLWLVVWKGQLGTFSFLFLSDILKSIETAATLRLQANLIVFNQIFSTFYSSYTVADDQICVARDYQPVCMGCCGNNIGVRK